MKEIKHIVYLYSEVMPYAIAVMRALVQEHGVQVDCIYWDENKRTPFLPADENGITFHKRSLFDEGAIIKFIANRNPSIVYVVGRMDKLYLKAAHHFKSKCRIVSGSDNQWTGSLKQKVAVLFSSLLYRRYFEYFWVPGKRQYAYAEKMGYAKDKIINNLLTADTNIFGSVYMQNRQWKKNNYPHTIVYAGRFAEEKGLVILLAAFTEAKEETKNDWRLVLVGSGPMQVNRDSFIDVKGYMTGVELAAESKHWGVFCLPSIYEPWGVVVHEFAMAGLPFMCSDAVGAADALVADDSNGYIFKSGDKHDLKRAILKMMAKSDDELLSMGERSYELSKINSPSIAAKSLASIVK